MKKKFPMKTNKMKKYAFKGVSPGFGPNSSPVISVYVYIISGHPSWLETTNKVIIPLKTLSKWWLNVSHSPLALKHSSLSLTIYLSTEQYYNFPAKRLTPRIANIKKTIIITIPTLRIAPKDEIRATTKVFMLELCDMNLSGLKIRKSLKILIIGMFTFAKLASINEVKTMKQSN